VGADVNGFKSTKATSLPEFGINLPGGGDLETETTIPPGSCFEVKKMTVKPGPVKHECPKDLDKHCGDELELEMILPGDSRWDKCNCANGACNDPPMYWKKVQSKQENDAKPDVDSGSSAKPGSTSHNFWKDTSRAAAYGLACISLGIGLKYAYNWYFAEPPNVPVMSTVYVPVPVPVVAPEQEQPTAEIPKPDSPQLSPASGHSQLDRISKAKSSATIPTEVNEVTTESDSPSGRTTVLIVIGFLVLVLLTVLVGFSIWYVRRKTGDSLDGPSA